MTAPQISPREAIIFALDVAGIRNVNTIAQLILLGLKLTGWKIVPKEEP